MAQTQPNVIWVLTDQQRAMMLSCNGDPNVHTPNIDALADMGVNFTRAVSGYPLCCPFRGSMRGPAATRTSACPATSTRCRRRCRPSPTCSTKTATTPPTSASGTWTASTSGRGARPCTRSRPSGAVGGV